MSSRIFISHASGDRSAAMAICCALESAEVPAWIAPRDIPPGAVWGDALHAAIEASAGMLVVLSHRIDASRQIVREVSQAVDRGVPIIPVRIEDWKPTGATAYLLDTHQWLDAFPAPLTAYLPRIVASVTSANSQHPREPAKPKPPSRPFVEVVPDKWSAQSGRRRRLGSLFDDR